MSPGIEHTVRYLTSSPQTIVVVEDERIAAEDLRRRLESWGYRVQAIVASGEEAIRVAEAIRPDLMLMDIRLKGPMDGVEAARRIKSRMNIPVVFAASFSDPATLKRAQLSEPSGLISKPFDDKEIRFTIATALAKRAMERQIAEVEERYRRLLAMSSDMVMLLRKGRIVHVNNAALKTLGYTLNDLLRFDLHRLCTPESAPALKLILGEIESGIPHSSVEIGILNRSGSVLSVVLSGESCVAGGEPATLIIMTDLTGRISAEAEAARFAEELFDARSEADERAFELVHAHRELSELRDAVEEERTAQRIMTAKWREEIRACAATVQSSLSRCSDHLRSPEHHQLMDEIGRAMHILQQAIPAIVPTVTPEPGSAARDTHDTKDSPDRISVRLQL